METHLKDKVVLITGASGGIGAEVARKFANEGARLALHYRHGRDQANKLFEELHGTEVLPLRADLTKEADVKKLFVQTVRRFGRVDTLIANASSWETREVPLQRMSSRQWHKTLDNVLTCTFYTVREFLRIVARQHRGNLVLVGSTAAVFGEAGHADYAASKAAVSVRAYAFSKKRDSPPRPAHSRLLRRACELRLSWLDGCAAPCHEASRRKYGPESDLYDGPTPTGATRRRGELHNFPFF